MGNDRTWQETLKALNEIEIGDPRFFKYAALKRKRLPVLSSELEIPMTFINNAEALLASTSLLKNQFTIQKLSEINELNDKFSRLKKKSELKKLKYSVKIQNVLSELICGLLD